MTAARRSSLFLIFAAALVGAVVLGARLLPAREDGTPRIPTGEFRSVSSLSVSYDGRPFVFSGRREADGAAGIWEMAIDGPGARLVTRGNGEPADPIYLPDGRILYSDSVAADRTGVENARALYSCRDDGSEAARLTFGAHADGRPEMLPDGRVLFERRYSSPITERASIRMTIHPDGTQVAFHDDGTLSGMTASEPGTPRARPPILTSVVSADRHTGTLLCLDAYASRLPVVAALPRGAIRTVVVTRANEGAGGEILGEARVHPDGSFFIEVPADVALRLTLLGEDRRPLASLDSGVWVRANENRGCIGCHEEPDLAPENRRPLAIAEPPVSYLRPSSNVGVAHDH